MFEEWRQTDPSVRGPSQPQSHRHLVDGCVVETKDDRSSQTMDAEDWEAIIQAPAIRLRTACGHELRIVRMEETMMMTDEGEPFAWL